MHIIRKITALAVMLCLLTTAFCAQAETDPDQTNPLPSPAEIVLSTENGSWSFGFGRRQILPDENSEQPLYIAGYNSAMEISGVLDYCEARALWLDAGGEGVLLIAVDCVALDSATVAEIRGRLADISDCASVNVISSHTHAGADTLGLWGPMGISGKNDDYMNALITAAAEAGREASENRQACSLRFGLAKTVDMYRDSRIPDVFDANLYQLRVIPDDGGPGVRLYIYGAHAESLRGDNSLLSRDFPGVLCDRMTEITGDNTMFMPGPIGGLIMTKEFRSTDIDAVRNLTVTADKLIDYAQSITPETEQALAPEIALSRQEFIVPLDNTAFLLYRFLGIIGSNAVPFESATGYGVKSELSVLTLGDIALALIPGEIFPELVTGEAYGDANPSGVNPRPLKEIAEENGLSGLIVAGLANDELGYIVPPSDFLLNEKLPYLEKTMDYKGENHYEETNSVGPECANVIAEAFEAAAKALSGN